MSEVLTAVTAKISALQGMCEGVDTQLSFKCGNTEYVGIPVAPTQAGRALLQALLVETGRYEQEQVQIQLRAFERLAEEVK